MAFERAPGPLDLARKQLLLNWCRLVQKGLPKLDFALRRAWERCLRHLWAVKYPWQHAKGPMSAVIALLMHSDWNPVAWDEWIMPDGVAVNIGYRDNLQPAALWKTCFWAPEDG